MKIFKILLLFPVLTFGQNEERYIAPETVAKIMQDTTFLNRTTAASRHPIRPTKPDTTEVWALIIVDTITGYSETKRVFMETIGKAADLEIKPPPENKRYWYINGEYVRDGHDMMPSEWTYRWKSNGQQVFIDPKLVLMTFKINFKNS